MSIFPCQPFFANYFKSVLPAHVVVKSWSFHVVVWSGHSQSQDKSCVGRGLLAGGYISSAQNSLAVTLWKVKTPLRPLSGPPQCHRWHDWAWLWTVYKQLCEWVGLGKPSFAGLRHAANVTRQRQQQAMTRDGHIASLTGTTAPLNVHSIWLLISILSFRVDPIWGSKLKTGLFSHVIAPPGQLSRQWGGLDYSHKTFPKSFAKLKKIIAKPFHGQNYWKIIASQTFFFTSTKFR